jgi:zinc protease
MRRMKFVYAFLLSASLLIAGAAFRPVAATAADGGGPAAAPSAAIHVPLQAYTLKNGLRVILSEDHSAPTYSISITYDVGSRNEKVGHTGFAHLFEHMMFEGSENVGKGEHMILVMNNGGNMNGTTNEDRTNYFETLPANQLDLGLFLESDRMRALAINQANLDNQRNAVQEERRLGEDNAPYGKTFETLLDLAYDNPAYKHSTIGSMADLNAASVKDVADFFKMYYAPNNAVLVLVGDFKPDEAMAKVRKYFEDIPRQPEPPQPDMTEPAQNGERRKTIDDNFAQLPRLDTAYKIPAGNTPDWYALDVLSDILTGGQSSRMYLELVKEKELVTNVFAAAFDKRGPSLFLIGAIMKPGKDIGDVEKAFSADLERVKTDGVTQAEVDKALAQDRTGSIRSLQSTLGRAVLIGQFAVYYHAPDLISTRIEKFQSVTPADVKRVAQKYLTSNNRTVVITMPKAATPAKSGQ